MKFKNLFKPNDWTHIHTMSVSCSRFYDNKKIANSDYLEYIKLYYSSSRNDYKMRYDAYTIKSTNPKVLEMQNFRDMLINILEDDLNVEVTLPTNVAYHVKKFAKKKNYRYKKIHTVGGETCFILSHYTDVPPQ